MTQVDRSEGLVGNTAIKAPCRLATTVNLASLAGLLTIDGSVTVAGDRVLVKNQTSGVDNGIYVVDTGAWDRAQDCDGSLDLVFGSLVKVNSGATNQGFWYVSTTTDPIVCGSTSIAFTAASSTLAVVSAFMQTVLDDADAATARATLGAAGSGLATASGLTANTGKTLARITAAAGAVEEIDTPVPIPQGRITFTTATPVLKTTVTAQGTIYYTPYVGNLVPIYNGTNLVPTAFSELSQVSTDNTKSPAAVAADKVYDLFVWSDAGTMRCTRGPAWTNDTTRGYTLTRTNGILLNTSAITNGPAALRGTYVGTVFSNGSSLFDFQFGAAAAGGTAGLFGLWNAYNRVSVGSFSSDTTANWTYNSATMRAANGSNTMRCTFVDGISDEVVKATYGTYASSAAGDFAVDIGLDSTTTKATDSSQGYGNSGAAQVQVEARYSGFSGVGKHYLQALEKQFATGGAATFGGGANQYSHLIADLRL